MSLSAWFIGSVTIPATAFRMDDGGGVDIVSVPAGSYYLRSATGALSLFDVVTAAILAATGVTATFTMRRNRRVRVVLSTASTISWDDAPAVIGPLLGFTSSDIGGTTYDADVISPMLFSPGYLANPTTIEGVTGYTIPHQAIRKSADGTQVQCDHYGQETWQELAWSHIMPERLRTNASVAGQGGTFHQFYEQCAMLRRRFLYHQEIDEDDTSTDAVAWTSAIGPYVLRPGFTGDWYRRNVPFAEISSPLALPIHLVAEYG